MNDPAVHTLGGSAGIGYGHVVDPDKVDTSHGPILYLDDITVSFDGFKALNKLSLTIERGELRCIIGPNGAGKTTMMDVITGKTRPDAGSAYFGQTFDLTKLPGDRDRAARHRSQVPEAHGVRESHRVRESRAGDEDGQARAPDPARAPVPRAARPDRPHAEDDSARRQRSSASPDCCRTGRSSGSRSACCWCRSRT